MKETTDKLVHRAGKMGYSICHRKCEMKDMTLHDDKVNCDECIKILQRLQYAQTKTDLIKKIRNE